MNSEEIESDVRSSAEYQIVSKYYELKRAARSDLPYMNHIDEGVKIIADLNSWDWPVRLRAAKGFCLHPIVQRDAALEVNYRLFEDFQVSPTSLILAVEYRSVANEYLSDRVVRQLAEIRLSPITEVNLMLLADKIQNRKDFKTHHEKTHQRSKELTIYFRNWIERLAQGGYHQ